MKTNKIIWDSLTFTRNDSVISRTISFFIVSLILMNVIAVICGTIITMRCDVPIKRWDCSANKTIIKASIPQEPQLSAGQFCRVNLFPEKNRTSQSDVLKVE
jgi:hypothetical protein